MRLRGRPNNRRSWPWARMGQLKNEKEEQALVPLDGTRVLPG